MLQMDFSFFNVEIIRGFTTTFFTIYSNTSHPFIFPPRSKSPPLDILKCIAATLRNQDEKVALIWVNEDGALEMYSELMKKFHNMNIIVQTKVGDASSLNFKIENPK